MKYLRRFVPSPPYSLPILALVLLLVALSSCALAVAGFPGMFSASLFNTPRGLLTLVFGPLALVAFSGLFLLGAVSDSFRRSSANRPGNRLFLAMCAAIACATIPQAFVVGRFVASALDTWFSRDMSGSLASAADIADLYESERTLLVFRASGKYFTGLSISTYRARPSDWMPLLRAIDPYAAACQVYETITDDSGEVRYNPIVETGNSSAFVSRDLLSTVRDGIFSLPNDTDILRRGAIVRYGNAAYVCAYASTLPGKFVARAEAIRAAQGQAAVIDTLKPYLPIMGVWIFLMFCFPSILMAVVLSYALSRRLTEPILALEEASARAADGDRSYRVVARPRSGYVATARLVNAVSGSGDEPKAAAKIGAKPDKRS